MLGYTPQALLQKKFSEVTHPDDWTIDQVKLPALVSGEMDVYRRDKRYIHRDGHIVWGALNLTVARDPDGVPLYFTAQIQDITQQRRAGETLRMTQFSVDHLALLAFWIEPDARIKYANLAACTSLGYTQDELRAMKITQIDLTYDDDVWPERWQRLKKHQSLTVESTYQRRDGSIFPVEVTANYLEFGGKAYNVAFARDITARKRAEQERARLVTILETTSDVVSTASPEKRITFMNKAGHEILGWEPEEAIGREIADTHPQWAFDIIADEGIPTAIRDGVWIGETAILGHDGDEIPVSQVIMSHQSAAGDVEYLSTILRDISEQKRAEKAIRDSERLLTSVLDALDGMLLVIDRDRRIILSNWNGHDFVTEREKQDPAYCYKIFKHLDEPCEYCPPMDTFADGKFRIYDDRNPIDGSFKEIRVMPILDDDGDVAYVIEYVQDVTKRKQAEELLKVSEEKFSRSFHYSNDAIVLVDTEGRVLDVNQKALNQFAYIREEILALSVFDLCASGASDETRRIMGRVAEEGFARFEIDLINKNGRSFSAEVSASLFEVSEGKVIQNVIRDITERKQAEQERARLLAQIQEQAQRVQHIVDTVPEGVLLLDVDHRIVMINPMGERVLGDLTTTQIGERLNRLGDCPLADILTSPPRGLWHEVKTAHQIFNVIARPIETGPQPGGWVIVIRDVTRERQIEQHVQQQERLAVVGQLAAGIAHDFNNIMATVVLYAQMTLRDETLSNGDDCC
ncbi:MAG TPA: PAS domain S-box protein [Chloroflexi bacterium]|nr:PAS domain S-box protein [Chloroflexota bacterium]